jgi:hypothetical protein
MESDWESCEIELSVSGADSEIQLELHWHAAASTGGGPAFFPFATDGRGFGESADSDVRVSGLVGASWPLAQSSLPVVLGNPAARPLSGGAS